MILHIPHSSDTIPAQFRDYVVLSDDELAAELLRMTDAFTDELFVFPGATTVRFPISRLLVDPERFADDAREPLSKMGMGVIYTRTASGRQLKRTLQPQERRQLLSHYERHHGILTTEVRLELGRSGSALIVDCHSFPSRPLPCDMDQTTPRPDFCVGTDPFHTPPGLSEMIELSLQSMGYSVGVNQPYEGALAPTEFYRQDSRVVSVMVEVNRSLYMNEKTGERRDSFMSVKGRIEALLFQIDRLQGAAPRDG